MEQGGAVLSGLVEVMMVVVMVVLRRAGQKGRVLCPVRAFLPGGGSHLDEDLRRRSQDESSSLEGG